jgi:hypothetical protein
MIALGWIGAAAVVFTLVLVVLTGQDRDTLDIIVRPWAARVRKWLHG